MWLILLQILCNLVSLKNVSGNFNILALQLNKKKLLYQCFIDGEKKGKKVSPEQVEQLIQKVRIPLCSIFLGRKIENCFYVLVFFWSMKTDVSLPLHKINKYYHNSTARYENYI